MVFGRIVRWTQIPASELGPARGPMPSSLARPSSPFRPHYLDAEEELDRPPAIDARAPAQPAPSDRALLQPGSRAGNVLIGILDVVLGIVRGVLGQAAGPAGPIVARAVPRITPASVAAAQQRMQAQLEQERAAAEAADAANRLVASDAGQALAFSRGRMEILGTSAINIDVETVRGRESITIPFEVVGPDDAGDTGGGTRGVQAL